MAEAAPAALTDEAAMRAFVRENRSLAEKIRDFFVRFAKTLREIAAGYGFDNEREEVGVMLKAATQDLVDVAETLDMALSATQERGGAEGAATGGRSGVTYSIRKGVTITAEQIQENVRTVAGMDSVASVDTFAFTPRELKAQIIEYFEKVGGEVENEVLGTVTLNSRGVKDSMAHGIGEAKAAAFKAVPEVIQNGLIVNWESNWKGRGYDSAILSAPIEIVSNGSAQRYYAGVVVIRKDQTQRFYTHEVVLQKEDGTHVVQTGVLNNQYLPGDALHLPIKSILDQINNVNTSEKTSQEQRELSDGETRFSLMNKREYAQFYSKVGEMKAGKSAQFHVSPDGQYVFDIENKLVYTDGNWMHPGIRQVVEFDLTDGTELDAAKSCFVECEDRGIEYERIQDILTGVFGKEVASIRLGTLRGQAAREDGRRAGQDRAGAGEGDRGNLSAEEGTRFSLKRTSALNQDTQLLLEGEDVQVDAQSVQAYARDALRADCWKNRGRRVRRSGAKCLSLRRACPDPRVSRQG